MKSGKELVKLLRSHGFVVESVSGSHYKMTHPDGRRAIVPFCNSQFPKKTYHAILKDAGLQSVVRSRVGKSACGPHLSP